MSIKWDQGSTRRGVVDVIVAVAVIAVVILTSRDLGAKELIELIVAAGFNVRGYIGMTHDD
jgi:hypothetical protein